MLRFEPLAEHHRELILSSDLQFAVWKWMPAVPGGSRVEAYFDYKLDRQKKGAHATFLLYRQSDDTLAGITGFDRISTNHRRVRNALAWHPPELTDQTLYLFGQLGMMERAYEWGAKRIEWRVNVENTFIMEQLKAVGPKQEALLRNYERMADGTWVDKAVFSFTREEMRARIAELRAELEA